jgi:hypothetical protein
MRVYELISILRECPSFAEVVINNNPVCDIAVEDDPHLDEDEKRVLISDKHIIIESKDRLN